jgi:hypothetical protein
MSQLALLHAQAYIRSLPPDQRRVLADPAILEVELALHGLDTKDLSADEMQMLLEEITGIPRGDGSPPSQQEPTGAASHDDLAQRIQQVLDTDQRICDWPIDALVTGPVVSLTGAVRTREEKRLVEDIIRSIPGVAAVVNDILIE